MTILIQGAMDCEINILLNYFLPKENKKIAGYDFYIANYHENKIIIAKTEIGLINASIATTIAINEFKPTLVINQGCAGSHVVEIKNGDLIIGENSTYINNFRTNPKSYKEGSNSLDWTPSKNSYCIKSTKKIC